MYIMKWLNFGFDVFKGSNIFLFFNIFLNEYKEIW